MAIAKPSGTRAYFAQRLRELRIPRGFKTARKLAQELGIDENRYTRYERAEVEPDLDLLVRIAEVLAVTPNDLLGVLAEAQAFAGFHDGPSTSSFGLTEGLPAPSAGAALRVSRERQRAMWALSRELSLTLDGDRLDSYLGLHVTATECLGQMQRATKICTKLHADTLETLSALSTMPEIVALPADLQERLSKLMDRVMTADSD